MRFLCWLLACYSAGALLAALALGFVQTKCSSTGWRQFYYFLDHDDIFVICVFWPVLIPFLVLHVGVMLAVESGQMFARGWRR